MVEFSSDLEMKKIVGLAREFSAKILDEKPLFISDEATVLDLSGAEPEELLTRISGYYGRTVYVADLKQPLWKLILQLNEGRK